VKVPYKGPDAFNQGDRVRVQAPSIGYPDIEGVVFFDYLQTYPSAVRWVEVGIESPGRRTINPDGNAFIEDMQCLICIPKEVTLLERSQA